MAESPINIQQRLKRLENHLAQEHPVLLDVVKSFRVLDSIAYRMGLLERNESFAARVPWWPMVSVLGTFSSGKSTFINDILGYKLQLTGNQAVDDKFTVICYSNDSAPRVLPGLALDADTRFPFYNISHEIEAVAAGEGRRVDAYLQLKTCPSEALKGKIVIDSPGFDADFQRTSTLRITKHIIDLSDLVLVFFDARHPEPGAMKDTLQHLVADTIKRMDSSKFLYVLNQIDATAREDNPEEVFAAWQRALAGTGLTAGRFYRIYNLDAANPIENDNLRRRFELKRAVDMSEIVSRIQQVEVERAYRIIGVLEETAKSIQDNFYPRLRDLKQSWKRRVIWLDILVFGSAAVGFIALSVTQNWWQDGFAFATPWVTWLTSPEQPWWHIAVVSGGVAAIVYALHFMMRKVAAGLVTKQILRKPEFDDLRDAFVRAFRKNTRPLRSAFRTDPVGWGRRARKQIAKVLSDADRYVQTLNDRFANPSGGRAGAKAPPLGADLSSARLPETAANTETETEDQDAKIHGVSVNR
jgi:hypothetical protein